MLKFIDVYSGTGKFDGSLLVQEQVQGGFVKLSQGTWYVNPIALVQAQVFWMLNLPVTFYHYFEPSKNTGKAEAEFFLAGLGELSKQIGGMHPKTSYAFDSEYGLNRGETDLALRADLRAHHLDAFGTTQRALGMPGFLYSSPYYMGLHNLTGGTDFAQQRLWVAAPGVSAPPPVDGWTTLFWQYDTTGVDRDYLLADSVDALAPYQWPQPDPLSGRTASGTPDLDKSTPVLAVVKHAITKLEQSPPDVPTAIADLAQWVDTLGLVGN